MSKTLLIARREMFAYLRSPLGSIVIGGALLADGILFYWEGLTQKLLSAEVLQKFFYNASGVTLAAAVMLSMRLLAEERQTGTITLLNTVPLRDREIVLGKFLSALGVIVVMTAFTIYMPLLIFVNGKVSWGHILVGYLGLALLGAAATAVGLFASALARSQVVAVIIAVLVLTPMYTIWFIAKATDPPLNTFFAALAFHHENFRPFMEGVLKLDKIVYYLAVTYVFLLAAVKTLEARRWR